MRNLIIIAALMLLPALAVAETTPFGLIQTWYSYTTLDSTANDLGEGSATQTGFGIKRARVGIHHKTDDFTGFFFYDAVPGKFVDAWIKYDLNEMMSLQAGRFRGVGCQASGLTSPVALDLVDYPLVAKGWAGATHGADSRSLGLQVNASIDLLTASAFFHNGHAGDNGYVPTAGANEVVDNGVLPKMDFGVYAAPFDGAKLGFTYGLPNEFRPQAAGEFVTAMTCFGYYDLNGLTAKVDYVNLSSKADTWDDDEDDYVSQGYALTLGYDLTPKLGLACRYDAWDADTDEENDGLANFTLGLNYSFDAENPYDQRLQVNLVYRLDETAEGVEIDNPYVLQAQWQYFIH